MHSILRYPAPHVVPGTNFNINRFRELYGWITSSAADAAQVGLNARNFGLMVPEDEKSAIELNVDGDTLYLSRCCGITPSGMLIGVFADRWGLDTQLKFDLSSFKEMGVREWDVLVVVEAGNRNLVGKADEAEIPYRKPFSIPQTRLEVHPTGQSDTSKLPDALKVGLLVKEEGRYQLKNYIPPCANLGAHPLLWGKYLEYQQKLGQLQEAMAVITKIAGGDERNQDIDNLRELTIRLGNFLAEKNSGFSIMDRWDIPWDMFSLLTAFAGIFHFFLVSTSRESELLALIHYNVDSSVGKRFQAQELRDAVSAMAGNRYDHHDILQTIRQADTFFGVVSHPFEIMKNRSRILAVSKVSTW